MILLPWNSNDGRPSKGFEVRDCWVGKVDWGPMRSEKVMLEVAPSSMWICHKWESVLEWESACFKEEVCVEYLCAWYHIIQCWPCARRKGFGYRFNAVLKWVAKEPPIIDDVMRVIITGSFYLSCLKIGGCKNNSINFMCLSCRCRFTALAWYGIIPH